MPKAGYDAALYLTGTSTAFTGEAMSLVSGTTYSIDDTAKELWDPDVALTVYDGASPVTGTFNRLEGQVTLDAAPGGAVTIDGNYLPLVEIGCATEWNVNISRTILDKTCFSLTDNWKKKFIGLREFKYSLTHLDVTDVFGTDDLDEILHGAQATGTITTIASASHVDTETFVIDDGINGALTFEFDNNASVTGGNVAVDITGAVSADVMRDRIITAINGATGTDAKASNGGAATVNIVVPYGAQGNNTITETVANAGFIVAGLTGGTDETLKVLQIQLGSTPDRRIRAFVIMSTKERSAGVDDRVEEALEFELYGSSDETHSET